MKGGNMEKKGQSKTPLHIFDQVYAFAKIYGAVSDVVFGDRVACIAQ